MEGSEQSKKKEEKPCELCERRRSSVRTVLEMKQRKQESAERTDGSISDDFGCTFTPKIPHTSEEHHTTPPIIHPKSQIN